MLPDSQYFGVRYFAYSLHFNCFGILFCGYCKCPQYFVRWYSDYCEYSQYRVHNFMPTVLPKTFTDGTTCGSWIKLLLVGATGVHRVLTDFGIIYCECLLYFEVLYCGYCLYSKYCGVSILREFDTAVTLGPVLLTLCVRSISAFSGAHSPSTRSI